MSPLRVICSISIVAVLAVGCGETDSDPQTFANISLFDLDSRPTRVTHDGRPLVINFFAESCPPCVAEMPALESVFQANKEQVDFIGISEDATAAAGRRITAATGVTYRTVWDADGTAIAEFEAMGMPTTVFVTATGVVADVHTGALSADALTEKVAELLAAG